MGRREERRLERRTQLLDSAMSILAEGGLEALTIPRLAKHMQASVGGLYRYFPSKEAIFVALQKRAIDTFQTLQKEAMRRSALEAQDASARVQALANIVAMFALIVDLAKRAPIEHALLDAFLSAPSPTLNDEQARDINAYLAPLLNSCCKELEKASAIGAIDGSNAMVKTHLMWASLHGLSHFRKRDRIQPSPLQVDALADTLIETLLRGWSARDEDIKAAFTCVKGTRIIAANKSEPLPSSA